ncbi:MAG: HipA domain-containing protein [Candidatus Cryptobacteroides sp.]
MGALCYVPETPFNAPEDSATLDEMQRNALAVLSEKDFSKAEALYVRSGNSGGCRPKCLWNDGDKRWLVKFRHTYDPDDMGKEEYDILKTAGLCGITVPEAKLFNGKYLGTRRFDIAPDGGRLHVATASGLLCESIRMPMMDYRKLIRFTQYLTGDISQAREMFRRMVFNYEIGNNDDHAKNFSFIRSDKGWICSPAYDITRCPNANNGFHASLVNGSEKPETGDFVAAGADAGLTKGQALDIIHEIRETVGKYLGRNCGQAKPDDITLCRPQPIRRRR